MGEPGEKRNRDTDRNGSFPGREINIPKKTVRD